MRWRMVWTLWHKELLETIRDKRTILVMILLPIVLYPSFGILASQARLAQESKIKSTKYAIGLRAGALPLVLKARLQHHDKIEKIKPSSPWRRDLRKGKWAVVLEVVASPKTPLHHKGQLELKVYYASTKDASRAVQQRVQRTLRWYTRVLIRERLKHHKIDPALIRPLSIKMQDTIKAPERGRFILSKIFPLMLILMTIMGAFYPAIDLTAGEKERGTLETLLTAPISPLEIVTGKYLTVVCIAMATGALNLLSLWFTFSHGLRLAGRGTGKFELGITPGDTIAIFAFLFLIAALASALMLTIASLARSFKEGQNYITPAYLVCILPAILPMLPGSTPTNLNAAIPVVNISFAIQMTLNHQLNFSYIFVTLVSMGLCIALSLQIAAHIFSHEQVLFREGEFSWRSLLPRRSEAHTPTSTDAILLLCLSFLLIFYVGIPLQLKNPATGLSITLWLLILAPTLAYTALRKFSWQETLRLRPFHPRILPGVILMSLGAIPIVTTLTTLSGRYFLPDWEGFLRRAQQVFDLQHFGVSPLVFILLLSLSPGICEEILFRGFVQSAFRKALRPSIAILLTALLFGAFHFSIHRLLPTTLLGIMLGWICLRAGSIYPAMLAHALINASSLGMQSLSKHGYLPKTFSTTHTVLLLLASALVLFAGSFLFLRNTQPPPPSQEEEGTTTASSAAHQQGD